MIRKFNQLKRRDFNSLAEYNDHFTEFSSSLQGIKSENDLVVSYIEGLGDKLGEEVAIRDTNNLEETMRLAIILDKTHSVHKQVNYVSKEINSSRGKNHINIRIEIHSITKTDNNRVISVEIMILIIIQMQTVEDLRRIIIETTITIVDQIIRTENVITVNR